MREVPRSWRLLGGQTLLDGQWVAGDLVIEDGRIAGVGEVRTDLPALEVDGARILPGLVELHTHGIGHLSPENASLVEVAAAMAARGCTHFLPTLFAPPERLLDLLRMHRRATDDLRACPGVGGFRLESPYLAATGAGVAQDLAPISPALTAALLEAGGGHIRVWDIAPELPGAPELIAELTARGIICSLAHTRANLTQARAAVDAGARLVTHLFDTFALPKMRDPGVYPAGLVDYLLVEDRVTCELIADGTHVHPLLLEKALRCKGRERIAFVTDGNYGAGLPPGDYELPNAWGPVRIDGPNDGVRLLERALTLAGSALTPLDLLHNAIERCGLDWAGACQVCASTPARVLGHPGGKLRRAVPPTSWCSRLTAGRARRLWEGKCCMTPPRR
jgi:N-acetylglucosamine-6-phosphate deacetylase